VCLFFVQEMADNISAVFTEYEERVRGLEKVHTLSHGPRLVRSDGAPNRAFFYSSFDGRAYRCDHL
jgi:hypothetical protein